MKAEALKPAKAPTHMRLLPICCEMLRLAAAVEFTVRLSGALVTVDGLLQVAFEIRTH